MKQDFGITLLKESYKNCEPGFRVRLEYKNNLPKIQQSFLFSDYGTIADAYYSAQEFRDKEIAKIRGEDYRPYNRVITKPQRNNTSGILGVQRAHLYSGGKRTHTFSWRAFWNVNGKVRSAQFSENKYGAREAKRRAIECRKAKKHLFL